MSEQSVVVIGIDGLDRGLVDRYADRMPNLHRLMSRGLTLPMTSVQPPDSNTAWATIYTGLNPAQHGFVHFMDPLNRIQLINTEESGAAVIRGKTFWDLAGAAGKRVSLVLPHIAYPVWPVNGFMVARSTLEDAVACWPTGAEQPDRLACLNTVKGFPGAKRGLPDYLARVRQLVRDEASLGVERLERRDWDLFFWYSSALDLIMHFFWHYADETDPSYPGPNEYESVIGDFHALYDDVIGQLVDHAPADSSIMLLSDHGHGMRPVRLLNINELLRRAGLYVPRATTGGTAAAIGLLERGKRSAFHFVEQHDLGPLASKVLRYLPAARKVFTNPPTIDWARTRAYTTDLSGIKSYSYGGILIRREGLDDAGYAATRRAAIAAVKDARDPATGARIVKMILPREELYQGEHLDRFPDIVFDLEYGYGAGWAANGELMAESPGHSLVPGSHKGDSAVLVVTTNHGACGTASNAELTDIAPTVLSLLGIPCPESCRGRSLLDVPRIGASIPTVPTRS